MPTLFLSPRRIGQVSSSAEPATEALSLRPGEDGHGPGGPRGGEKKTLSGKNDDRVAQNSVKFMPFCELVLGPATVIRVFGIQGESTHIALVESITSHKLVSFHHQQ